MLVDKPDLEKVRRDPDLFRSVGKLYADMNWPALVQLWKDNDLCASAWRLCPLCPDSLKQAKKEFKKIYEEYQNEDPGQAEH
jgi:hypothetical protein